MRIGSIPFLFPVFFCRFVCDKNAEIVQNQAGIDFLCILSGFDLNNAKLQEIKMTVGILCVDCRKCEVMQIDQMASQRKLKLYSVEDMLQCGKEKCVSSIVKRADRQRRYSHMKKIAYVLIFALLVPYLFVTQPTVASAKATYRGAYSNLVDAKSRKEVKKALLDAGLSEKNVNAWLSDVKDYNKTIKNTGLVKKGFKKLSTKNPQYDENKIMELWNKKYPDFIGYNCRITAFDLMKDKISVKADAKVNASNLFMDQDALKHAPAKKFTKKQKHAFETLYSTLNTAYTTDVDTHIKKQKKAWKQNEVKISGTKASLITVVFHSSFGENENELFIGHAGVLVPTKDKKLLFVEKLSFSLPYQVLKFDNRKQLKNYLMGMYDTSWGQEEAKPFIMENTKTVL